MQSLTEAIETFRQQVQAALAASEKGWPADGHGHGATWRADRVTLCLEVILDELGALQVVNAPLDPGRDALRHRISIEFQLDRPPAPSLADVAVSQLRPHGVSDVKENEKETETERWAQTLADEDRAKELLAALFGPPGFDSSARAAVFCEVLRELPAELVSQLPGSLRMSVKDVENQELRRARHLVLGLVQSGPLKSNERAADLLEELFDQRTASALAGLIERHWNIGETWAK